MPYVDPQTVHNPATGTVAPAAWGDTIRDDLEFLIDPPTCVVFNSSAQSVNASTATALTANSETRDNDAMHSTVSNTSRITIQTAGTYLFVARINYAANSSGDRSISLKIDATTQVDGPSYPAAASGIVTICAFAVTLDLNAAQYVECQAYQTTAGALNATLLEFSALFLTR